MALPSHLNSFVSHLKYPQLFTFLCSFCFLTGFNMPRNAPQNALSKVHKNYWLLYHINPPWLPIYVVTALALPSSCQGKPLDQKWVSTGIHVTISHTQLATCCSIQPLTYYEVYLRWLSCQNMSSCSFCHNKQCMVGAHFPKMAHIGCAISLLWSWWQS
jgi:hypothetical protein